MRFSLLGAGAALAAVLALSACNSSTTPSTGGMSTSAVMPSASSQVHLTVHGHKLLVSLMPGVKQDTLNCPGSKYSFCFYVTKGNSGPYVETSDGTSPLYNVGEIVKAKNNKLSKKFSDYFYPDPGDPTYQYITYTGKAPKKPGQVKYTDIYCIGFSQYACQNGSGSILYLGIAIY